MVAGRGGASQSVATVAALVDLFEGARTASAQPVADAGSSRQQKRKLDEREIRMCGAAGAVDSDTSPAEHLTPPPPHKDLRLGQTDLQVLLARQPNPGITYTLYELVGMRKEELLHLLAAMRQLVVKKTPTRLELLGAVVTLLLALKRLSL